MTVARSLFATAVAVGGALAIAWGSQAPTKYARADDALLRLSWRMNGVRVEECRERTPEELEALAPHMRTPEVCVGGGASYALAVAVDGTTVLEDTIAAGGARGDRPIYVHRELAVAPGRRGVRVTFEPVLPAGFDDAGMPMHRFDEVVSVAPTTVLLIGLDDGSGRLVRVGS